MLILLKSKLGIYISLRDLGKVAKTVDYPRAIRALRQEGWEIEWKREKGTTWYSLRSLTKKKTGTIRRPISKKIRYRILHRDNSVCQRCGRTPIDGVKMTIDHKVPVDWGGDNDEDNLWTLCRECNEGKQAHFKEFNAEAMMKILSLPSARARLQEFIRRNYGKPLLVNTLALVAKTRDWMRQIRRFRQLGYFDYDYNRANETYTFFPQSLLPASSSKR